MEDMRVQLSHTLLSPDLLLHPHAGARTAAVQQLGPIVQDAMANDKVEELLEALAELQTAREKDLKSMCQSPDNPFVDLVSSLGFFDEKYSSVSQTIALIREQANRSGSQLVSRLSNHQYQVKCKENIESALETIRTCLRALEHTNQVRTLLRQNNRVAAVRSIDELKNIDLNRMRYLGLANMLSRAVPSLTQLLVDSTLLGLSGFFDSLEKATTTIGTTCYSLMQKQKQEWQNTLHKQPHLGIFGFNSLVEKAYRETGPDYFNSKELISVDLAPLFEAELIFTKLDRLPQFTSYVNAARLRASKSMPISPTERELSMELVHFVLGHCIIDRTLSQQLPKTYTCAQANGQWDHLAQRLLPILTTQVSKMDFQAEHSHLTNFRERCGVMMDCLENFEFDAMGFAAQMRTLLTNYSAFLFSRAQDSFRRSFGASDHMPMVITKRQTYDKVMSVVWLENEPFPKDAPFPRVMAFSEVYAIVCAELRAMIAELLGFLQEMQYDAALIEDTILSRVDKFITDVVCKSMVSSLGTTSRERLMQLLIDLQYLDHTAHEILSFLKSQRTSGRMGYVHMRAIDATVNACKLCEARIYELVNAVINDFVDMAEYDWRTSRVQGEHSTYALEMAAYLLTMANSAFARLPDQLRSVVYLTAADHLNVRLMDLLKRAPEGITPCAIASFDSDLQFLESFVHQLAETANNPGIATTLSEVRQAVDLLASQDPTEYNQLQVRMRKYDRLSPELVNILVEKLQNTSCPSTPRTPHTGFMKYLSGD